MAVVGTPAGTQLAGLPGGIWSTGTVLVGVGLGVVAFVVAAVAVADVNGGVVAAVVADVVAFFALLLVQAARVSAAARTATDTAPRLDRMRENYPKDRLATISSRRAVDSGRLSTGQSVR